MKLFRVWPDGRVDSHLPVVVFDNVGYVPVGGSSMSYVTLDGKLLASLGAGRERTVARASFELNGSKVVLIGEEGEGPSQAEEPRQALVLLPARAAFAMYAAEGARPLSGAARYTADSVALLAVLTEGDTIIARPHARSMAESESNPSFIIHFDGENVEVKSRHAAALAA